MGDKIAVGNEEMAEAIYEEFFKPIPKRKCVMCGKPRLIERNCGQHNDGDDFCSDECYDKFDKEHAHIEKQFVNSLSEGQRQILRSIYEGRTREQGRVIFHMIEEQLDYIAAKVFGTGG